MKTTVATVLLVVSMVAGQPARHQFSARQQAAPDAFQFPAAQSAGYASSGWRPQGPAFNLPQPQPQQEFGTVSPSYGPPPPVEEPTTTEEDSVINSTDPPQFYKFEADSNNKKKSEKLKEFKEDDRKAVYFVVLPQSAKVVSPQTQSQNLVYAYPEVQKSAPLVTVPQATLVAAPLTAQLQSLPVSTYKALYYSPLTAPYAQVEW